MNNNPLNNIEASNNLITQSYNLTTPISTTDETAQTIGIIIGSVFGVAAIGSIVAYYGFGYNCAKAAKDDVMWITSSTK